MQLYGSLCRCVISPSYSAFTLRGISSIKIQSSVSQMKCRGTLPGPLMPLTPQVTSAVRRHVRGRVKADHVSRTLISRLYHSVTCCYHTECNVPSPSAISLSLGTHQQCFLSSGMLCDVSFTNLTVPMLPRFCKTLIVRIH